MTVYSADKILQPRTEPLPTEGFLLPICTTPERLNRILTALWWGGFELPSEPGVDDFSGHNIHGLTHMIDVLEGMQWINQPWLAPCYVPPEPDPESGCVQYPVSAPWLSYAPNDPFQTPDYIPPGYLLPPWYNNPGIPLPGVLPGDAMVNFAAFPLLANLGEILEAGLPRVSIPVMGEGELEIEFVNVPQGGYVLVNIDNDPLQTQLLDLNALSITDIASLEAVLTFFGIVGEDLGIEPAQTHEATITGAGAHVVNITFLPNIGSDTIFGFGGGIRRISLCGFDSVGEVPMPQIQIDDCILQWRPHSGTPWVDLGNVCGEDGQDGQPGQDAEPCIPCEDGQDGQPGQDGREIEIREYFGTVQWRYEGDAVWQTLYIIPSGGGGGEGAFNRCDYAYSAGQVMRNLLTVMWAKMITVTSGGWGETKRNITITSWEMMDAHYQHGIADTAKAFSIGVMYDVWHGRPQSDNVYATQAQWSLSQMLVAFDTVLPELRKGFYDVYNDYGMASGNAFTILYNLMDTQRKNIVRPIDERRIFDMLWGFFWNQNQHSIGWLAHDRPSKAPTGICEELTDPEPPPFNPCEDYDWGIEFVPDNDTTWEIIRGTFAADADGLFAVDIPDVQCDEYYNRVDFRSPFPGTVGGGFELNTWDFQRVEVKFTVYNPNPGTPVNLRLNTYLGTTLASQNVGEGVASDFTLTHFPTAPSSGFLFSAENCGTQPIQQGAIIAITAIRLCGNGPVPPWLANP